MELKYHYLLYLTDPRLCDVACFEGRVWARLHGGRKDVGCQLVDRIRQLESEHPEWVTQLFLRRYDEGGLERKSVVMDNKADSGSSPEQTSRQASRAASSTFVFATRAF